MQSSKSCLSFVAVLAFFSLVLGFSVVPAYAQFSCTAEAGVAIWNISGSGDWDVPGNWNPSTEAPNSSTTSVCILNSSATTVTLDDVGYASMDDLTINSADTLSVVSAVEGSLSIYGTAIENAGNIELSNAPLQLGANGDVTLSGGGTITMTAPSGSTAIIGNLGHTSNTLDNVDNIIEGNGDIEVTGLVNEESGTIDATTASGENTTLLVLASGGATNAGLMEATTGTLAIQDTTVANGGGNITANGGTVEISSSTIQGGTLTNINGGTLESVTGATLDGSTSEGAVTINGTYIDNTGTNINGTIKNNGTIYVNGTGEFATGLGIGSSGATENYATLEGGGTVTLFSTSTANEGPAEIEALSSPATLENVNNTIQGNGNIGGITLINDSDGIVDATTASGQQSTLSLTTAAVTNAGLMEASSGAELLIETPVDNTGGNITANGGSVVVENTITGGILNTVNGGTMEGNNAVLDGVTISNGTTFTSPGTSTGLLDTITNAGTILVSNGGSLGIGSSDVPNVTLQGGGTLTIAWSSSGAQTNISSAFDVSGATLTNVNNTIQGNGLIGLGGLALVNETNGVVDATTATGLNNTLTLADSGTVTNQGLLEATSGTLIIQNPVMNAGGNITANGGTVDVEDTITGGTLNTLNGGTMESLGYAALDGSTSVGAVTISSGSTYTLNGSVDNITYLKGTITNEGTFQIIGGGYDGAALDLESSVTLNGGGTLTLDTPAGAASATIQQVEGGLTLTNVDNTIEGNGVIGNVSGMDVVNDSSGTIEATTASGQSTTLLLNSGTLTNNGTLGATAGTTLHVQNPDSLTNYSSGTLTGGTYDANGTIQVDSLGSSGGEIVTNDANIILDGSNGGAAAFLDSASKNALSALATNEGSFTVENGGNADFTTAGNFTNSGTVYVDSASTLTIGASGSHSFTQSGGLTTVNGTLTSSAVAINGGLLNGTGTVVGAVTVGPGGSIQPGDAPGTLNVSGSLAINGAMNEEIDSVTSFDVLNITGTPGTLTLGSGSSLDIMLAPGYDPSAGTSFIIANFSSLSGTFGSIGNPTFNGGAEEWNVAYNSGDIVLTAENVTTTTTTVDANWTTGTPATWTTASNWACSPGASTCVPSNGTPANTVYDVNIDNTASGATMTLSTSETVDTLALTAGTLDIASTGSLNLANQPSGITDIPEGAGFSIEGTFTAGSNNALANLASIEGSLTLDNGQTTSLAGSLTNSGMLTVSTPSTVLAVGGGLNNNGGNVTIMGGGSATVGGNLTNSGTATVNGGTLTVTGAVSNGSGFSLAIENGGSVSAASVGNSGALSTGGDPGDTGNSLLSVSGNFTNAFDGTLTLGATGDEASVGGNFSNAGFVSVGAGATLEVRGTGGYSQAGLSPATAVEGTLTAASLDVEGGTYTNDTGVTNLGGATGSTAGNINIASAGTLTDNATVNVGNATTAGTVNNAGTVTVGASGTMTLLDNGTYTQTAGVTDVNGTLMAATVNVNGGKLSGNGTLQGVVTIATGGTLLPGETGTPGTLTVNGNVAFTGGTLDETISSAADNGYSLLSVSGTLDLTGGGNLDILLADNFVPVAGEQFLFATASALDGQFTISDPFFDSGQYEWTLSTTGDGVDIYLTAQTVTPSTTPEPTSLLLLGTGLLGLGCLLRRRSEWRSLLKF